MLTDCPHKSKPAAPNLSTKKLFLCYWSCLSLWPPPSPKGSSKPSSQVCYAAVEQQPCCIWMQARRKHILQLLNLGWGDPDFLLTYDS